MSTSAFQQYDIPERKGKLAVFDGHYLNGIPQFISEWQSKRIVLVASKALYNNTCHIQSLEESLGRKVVAKKIGVGAHSPYSDVIAIAQLLQDHQADCLICIGSSSYTDASKIASKLAATLPRGFGADDMENLVQQAKGIAVIEDANVKVILVPTSLSAAEWNGVGSCTNSKGKKQHFGLDNMKSGAADLVFCDPDLASTAPESLWLSSGARCIDHCVETICNRYCTQEAEDAALHGLSNMLKGLVQYKDGGRGDREQFLKGISNAQKGSREAIKAVVVNGISMGPSHAIGHQLGSIAGVAHGVTSCIMLAPTLKYTSASDELVFRRARSSQARILSVLNETLEWQETDLSDALIKFFKQLGLPTRLSEAGVTDETQIDRVAEATLTDIWGGGERQLTSKEEVKKILNMAR